MPTIILPGEEPPPQNGEASPISQFAKPASPDAVFNALDERREDGG